ncbi:hypothetical protein V2J09_003497 [Rumex salicifolius]
MQLDGKRVPGSRACWFRCEPEQKQMETADKSDPHPNIVEVSHGPEFKKQKSNIFLAEKAA